MNRSHEKREARYWAHGVISDLVYEYLETGVVNELKTVLGSDKLGERRFREIKTELLHFAEFHDVRRVERPRAAHKVPKKVFSGKKTGGKVVKIRRVK